VRNSTIHYNLQSINMLGNIRMEDLLLTGITGVVGSQVLYELLRSKKEQNFSKNILLVVRSKNDLSAEQRVRNLLTPSLLPDDLKTIDVEKEINDFIIIDSDIKDIERIKNQIPAEIKSCKIIHLASSVKFIIWLSIYLQKVLFCEHSIFYRRTSGCN